jgi:hypothetical protein
MVGGKAGILATEQGGQTAANRVAEYRGKHGGGSSTKQKRTAYNISTAHDQITYDDAEDYKTIRDGINNDEQTIAKYEKIMEETGGVLTASQSQDYENTLTRLSANNAHYGASMKKFIREDNFKARDIAAEAMAKITSTLFKSPGLSDLFDEYEADDFKGPEFTEAIMRLEQELLDAPDDGAASFFRTHFKRRFMDAFNLAEMAFTQPGGAGEASTPAELAAENLDIIIDSIKEEYGGKMKELFQQQSPAKVESYTTLHDIYPHETSGKSDDYYGAVRNYGVEIKNKAVQAPNSMKIADTGESLGDYVQDLADEYPTLGNVLDDQSMWNFDIVPVERAAGAPLMFKAVVSAKVPKATSDAAEDVKKFNTANKNGRFEFMVTAANPADMVSTEDFFLSELQLKADQAQDPVVKANIQREHDYISAVRKYGGLMNNLQTTQQYDLWPYKEDAQGNKAEESEGILINSDAAGDWYVKKGKDINRKAGTYKVKDPNDPTKMIEKTRYEATPNLLLYVKDPVTGEEIPQPLKTFNYSTGKWEVAQNQTVEELMLNLYRTTNLRKSQLAAGK